MCLYTPVFYILLDQVSPDLVFITFCLKILMTIMKMTILKMTIMKIQKILQETDKHVKS